MMQLYTAVGFKNGKKEWRKFLCRRGPTTGAEFRLQLTSIFPKLVAGWGLLLTNRQHFDEIMCHEFSLHDILEILVELKVMRRSGEHYPNRVKI